MKRIKKIGVALMLIIVFAVGVFALTACNGKNGSIYTKSDMTALSTKFDSYKIDVDIEGIINSTSSDAALQNVSLKKSLTEKFDYDYKNALLTALDNKVVNLDNDIEVTTTLTDYQGLFSDLQNIQNNADYMSQIIRGIMKALVAVYPEQNQWIAFTSDRQFEKREASGGNVSISKLIVQDGFTEFFEINTNGTMTGDVMVCYAKITEVSGSNEPIVEFQGYVSDKGTMYMYYVPNQEVKIVIGDTRDNTEISLYQHCKIVEENGKTNFYYTNQPRYFKQYIAGNLDDGFVEVKSFEPDAESKTINYYKDGYRLMHIDTQNHIYFNFEASKLEKEFAPTTLMQVEVGESGAYGQRYQRVQGNLVSLQYASNPIDDQYPWMSDFVESTRSYTLTVNDTEMNIGTVNNTSLAFNCYSMDAELDKSSLYDRFEYVYRENAELVIDALFTENNYNLYQTKLAYAYSTTLKEDVETALNTTNVRMRHTNSEALAIVQQLTANDVHFIYRTVGQSLEPNYQNLQIVQFSTDEFGMVSANPSEGQSSASTFAENDATIVYTNDFNGFDARKKIWQIIYALEMDGQYIEIATGNKLLSESGDSRIRSEVESTVTFRVQAMLELLDTAGKLEDGRYNLRAYYKDNQTKEIASESITSIVSFRHDCYIGVSPQEESIYYYFTYTASNGAKYNVAAHRNNNNPDDYDSKAYFLISEVR